MPRTQITTKTLYRYDELSETAKKKARERIAEFQTDYGWWESVYEDAEQVGIKITSFDCGRSQEIDGKIDQVEATANLIVKNHGEMCETYKTAAAYLKERAEVIAAAPKDEDGEVDEYELDEKLDELDEEFTKSILEDYLSTLGKELEYLYSAEAIEETIEANEYEFEEDGKLA